LDGSIGSRGSTIRHSSSLTNSLLLMSASLAPRRGFETHSKGSWFQWLSVI
jgi:hypothetical protein